MKCLNAASLRRKSGEWGTQHLLPVWQNHGRFSPVRTQTTSMIAGADLTPRRRLLRLAKNDLVSSRSPVGGRGV